MIYSGFYAIPYKYKLNELILRGLSWILKRIT